MSLFFLANFLSSFLIQATCLSYCSFIQAIAISLNERSVTGSLDKRTVADSLNERSVTGSLDKRTVADSLNERTVTHHSSFRLPVCLIVLLFRRSVTV
jgi:hypothetical protein